MNCYQMSCCGQWQSDMPGHAIGSILSCTRCNALRAVVIGMTEAMRMPG
jgi:hypothetical protein